MQRLRIIFKSGHVESLLAEKWDLSDSPFVNEVNISGTGIKQTLKILDYSTLAAVVVEDVGADPYRAG